MITNTLNCNASFIIKTGIKNVHLYFHGFNKIQMAAYLDWVEFSFWCTPFDNVWFLHGLIIFFFDYPLDILHGLVISICLSCLVQIKDLIASKLIILELVQFNVNPRTLHSSLPESVR